MRGLEYRRPRHAGRSARPLDTRAASGAAASLASAWSSIERLAFAPNTPDAQRRESRRMFYAGAQALLGAAINNLDPGEDPTDADLDRMSALNAELVAFTQAVTVGRA